MNGRDTPFGPQDDVWLAAAITLHLAATAGAATRQHHLYESLGIAIDLLGDEQIDAYVRREWQGDRSYVEAMAILADLIHDAGALHLAAIMLDDLAFAAPDLSMLERGRILALRARVDRKMGRLDDAVDRYQYIAALGKRARSPELEARAEVGLAAVAQLRGNLPDLRSHSRRAAELSEANAYSNLARLAQQGLTMAAAKTGEYDEALIAGWKVVQLSNGDALLEAEALQNLGQLMLEAGHTAVARASFAAVMTRPAPPHVLLPALGGLALASARLGGEATVEWCVREAWRALGSTVPRYELAAALLECAVALSTFGRHADSERYRRAALDIAQGNGFHELVFGAADLEKAGAAPAANPPSFRPSAAAVARELSALEPEQLPTHVEFEAAPA
ncbi:MAG: hypothetical protein WD825_16435 [Gemmatimonadaceae bacterium]